MSKLLTFAASTIAMELFTNMYSEVKESKVSFVGSVVVIRIMLNDRRPYSAQGVSKAVAKRS